MFEGITPAELVTVVEESRRDEAQMHARRMTGIAGLLWHHTVAAEGFDLADPGYALITGFARTVADVGAALNLPPAAASRLVSQAEALDTRLPRMLDLLARNQLDWADVKTIIERTDCVDHHTMAAIDAALAAKITGWDCWSRTRLRNAVDAAIRKHDPEGAKERRKTADTARRVRVTSLPNGMARIDGYVSAAVGALFNTRLEVVAATVCPHDPRSTDQRHADALDAIGHGRFTLLCACGDDDCPIQITDQQAAAGAGGCVINVIASAATVTGDSEDPGFLVGYGVIDAEQVRDLADQGAVLRPVVPPARQGGVLARHQPSTATARWVRCRDLTCSFPGCDRPAWKADLDHCIAFDHDNPLRGGWTMPSNLDSKCRHHHRLKTFDCGWRDRQYPDGTIEWTSPTGRVYRSTPDGAELFDDINAALPTPRRRNHRLDKARRSAATRAGLQAKRAANLETQRINQARAWEIDLRQWRNRTRDMLLFFKGKPSTSPFAAWVNNPYEDEHITADWLPPPPPPPQENDTPPF